LLEKRYDIHQAVWLFAACCIGGFLMESLESLISLGYVQNRQGLLYGPFTPVYGAGALVLALCWPIVKNRPWPLAFAVSTLSGSAMEYLWSLTQELLFDAIFWDYRHLPLQLDGRVNVLFALFWGILGTLLLKRVYPPFCNFMATLPSLGRGLVTWALVLLLMGDFTISSCALFRQRARQYAVAASSPVEVFLDNTFSDEWLKVQFPCMQLRTE